MDGYKYVDLVWTDGLGKELGRELSVRLHFISEPSIPPMYGKVTTFLKDLGWQKVRRARKEGGHCICRGSGNDQTFLVAVSGDSLQERLAIAAHEAYHLTEFFWEGRRIPRNSSISREEHKARLVETVMREYYRLCESGS